VDFEEESERVHLQCKAEWETEHCPVCHKPVGTKTEIKLSPEMLEKVKDKIYRPGDTVTEQDERVGDDSYRRFLERLVIEEQSEINNTVDEEMEEAEDDDEEEIEVID
jgi:hypothetical protein